MFKFAQTMHSALKIEKQCNEKAKIKIFNKMGAAPFKQNFENLLQLPKIAYIFLRILKHSADCNCRMKILELQGREEMVLSTVGFIYLFFLN